MKRALRLPYGAGDIAAAAPSNLSVTIGAQIEKIGA